jgi:hypothetical protein
MKKRFGMFAFFGLLSGCAPRSATTEGSEASSGFTSPVLTAEELRSSGSLGVTAYEAVRRLRPGFLIDRTAGARRTTQPIQVSVNRGQFSPISILNTIPASAVTEIRYLSLGEATQRYGAMVTGPVIVVSLSTRLVPDP